MKNVCMVAIGVLALLAAAAYARPLSRMEWMDPKSIGIWQSLSADEKFQSVVALLNEQQEPFRSMKNKDFLLTDTEISEIAKKAQACIETEIQAPDLKGEDFPLYQISGFCTEKYVSMLRTHKIKQRTAEQQ